MGIQGLLPQLRSIMAPIDVEELRGQRVAIDTYSWLHKGALSCSTQLCKGIPTSKHIDYCMHRVNMLRHHGVKPILVFDGGLLPMKMDQETKRARARKENLERALEHEATGNSAAAYECFQKAVDISPAIACGLIQVLQKEQVDYIVAPYEADAQMTFLSINKHVDAVITEDSDLIPFGCSRIIFKMDKYGHAIEFQSSKLGKNSGLDFTGFTTTMLLEMCIFSGCDYLQSLPGMGLKRAYTLIQKFKSSEKVIKHLRYNGVSVPPLYEETFKKAMWAFRHQRVYDPIKEDIAHLSDVPDGLGHDLEFLGPWLPQTTVRGIAKGDLDPFTKMPFLVDTGHNVLEIRQTNSVKDATCVNGRKRLDLPAQKNVLTNYFCLASLEAKRKFIAPKHMPKHTVVTEFSSTSFIDHAADLSGSPEEAIACPANGEHRYLWKGGNCDELASEDKISEKCSSEGGKVMEPSLDEHPTSKPFLVSHEGYHCNSALSAIKSNAIAVTKAPLRSKYFQRKSVGGNNKENQNEGSILDKEDPAGILAKCPMSEGGKLRNNHQKLDIKKRKLVQLRSTHKGAPPLKNMRATSLLPKEGNDFPMSANEGDNITKAGSLGCDISHLKSYSGIAEESMERFAALMASFRYTSSGSRASGLRAPLKDVGNTCLTTYAKNVNS